VVNYIHDDKQIIVASKVADSPLAQRESLMSEQFLVHRFHDKWRVPGLDD
jgi:hypothetical protein